MAKKPTSKRSATKAKTATKGRSKPRLAAPRRDEDSGQRGSDTTGEAFIKLLQSPFVAELVAVAATAALAALAEHGFSNRGGGGGTTGKRAGRAVKAAGAAAASAVGRRLSNEIEEIRNAAKEAKGGAKA
jgi:hypothetical protein